MKKKISILSVINFVATLFFGIILVRYIHENEDELDEIDDRIINLENDNEKDNDWK